MIFCSKHGRENSAARDKPWSGPSTDVVHVRVSQRSRVMFLRWTGRPTCVWRDSVRTENILLAIETIYNYYLQFYVHIIFSSLYHWYKFTSGH